MITNRIRVSFLKWIIKSVVKVVKNISAIRKIKEMTGYTKVIIAAPASNAPPKSNIENANIMTKWHPNIIICTFLISLNIVLFLIAKVNKNIRTAKEIGKSFSVFDFIKNWRIREIFFWILGEFEKGRLRSCNHAPISNATQVAKLLSFALIQKSLIL